MQEPNLGHAKKGSLLEKNKKWVMARMGGPAVAANTVSPETQVRPLVDISRINIERKASPSDYF